MKKTKFGIFFFFFIDRFLVKETFFPLSFLPQTTISLRFWSFNFYWIFEKILKMKKTKVNFEKFF